MSADPGHQAAHEPGAPRPSAVSTLLKIQGQVEEWERRDRAKRRRNAVVISGFALAIGAAVALVAVWSGSGERAAPAAKRAATPAPAPARAEDAPVTRYITALTPEPRFAQYAENWRRKIEAFGTEHFPPAVRRTGQYGSLVLTTFIRPDGALEHVEVSRSSGHAALDQAAVEIVRSAAPFAPFPDEIRRDTAFLAIVRTFSFQRAGPPPAN